jgi:hypothetical protein
VQKGQSLLDTPHFRACARRDNTTLLNGGSDIPKRKYLFWLSYLQTNTYVCIRRAGKTLRCVNVCHIATCPGSADFGAVQRHHFKRVQ